LKKHEILLRGLIRVFGAVLPRLRLEAKVLEGPQNGVFEDELGSVSCPGLRGSRPSSRAAEGNLGAAPKGGEEESEEKRKSYRHSSGVSGDFCLSIN